MTMDDEKMCRKAIVLNLAVVTERLKTSFTALHFKNLLNSR